MKRQINIIFHKACVFSFGQSTNSCQVPSNIDTTPFSLEADAFKTRSQCVCREAYAFILTSVMKYI